VRSTYRIKGYSIHRRDRLGKLGGGLLIYTSKELNTIRRDDLEMQEIEAISIEVKKILVKYG
jgi:hypothetical protein